MRKILVIACVIFCFKSKAQVDPVKFFSNDTTLQSTLTTDFAKYIRSGQKPVYLPATFTCTIADSVVSEKVRIMARGNVRREICYMPPVKINFHNATSPVLYPLNSLKLVCACYQNDLFDQNILKEYLCYKIYNMLTEKSFNVRLLNLNYEDVNEKKKTVSEHAFFLEDSKALAKRNNCEEMKDIKLQSEVTDRKQMTMVAVFEYMIGNTDWGVSANHNTVLIQPTNDSASRPYVVPYDFDYSGLVNADYAIPSEGLGIDNVRQRLYRGFPRTLDELNETFAVFNNQKENIYSMIKNFLPLSKKNRDDIIDYLDEFYKTINDSRQVKDIFIDHARGN